MAPPLPATRQSALRGGGEGGARGRVTPARPRRGGRGRKVASRDSGAGERWEAAGLHPPPKVWGRGQGWGSGRGLGIVGGVDRCGRGCEAPRFREGQVAAGGGGEGVIPDPGGVIGGGLGQGVPLVGGGGPLVEGSIPRPWGGNKVGWGVSRGGGGGTVMGGLV